jgi:hypothetical protein
MFPIDAAVAVKRQQNFASSMDKALNLGGGVTLALKHIPAGEFVMGNLAGQSDERPRAKARLIDRSGWARRR